MAYLFFFFNFRLYLKGHTGTAGKQSSLILHGADFSTKDADNDNCMCKCALMLTGGKSYGAFLWVMSHWFEAWGFLSMRKDYDLLVRKLKSKSLEIILFCPLIYHMFLCKTLLAYLEVCLLPQHLWWGCAKLGSE